MFEYTVYARISDELIALGTIFASSRARAAAKAARRYAHAHVVVR